MSILTYFAQFTPMPQLVDDVPFESSDYISAEYAPRPAIHPTGTTLQSTSSLLNWNGVRMVCTSPQPTQFLSSTSVSISGLPSLDMTSAHMLSEYTTGGNPEPISDSQMFGLGSAMHYTIQGDVWMSQLELQYPSPSDQDASRVAPAAGVAPEAIDTQPMHEPSAPTSGTPNTMYGAGGGSTLAPQVMEDYGLSLGDSIPVDFLRSGTGSNAENLYAMDTDDFFNHNY
jgi:hypothetical protein